MKHKNISIYAPKVIDYAYTEMIESYIKATKEFKNKKF